MSGHEQFGEDLALYALGLLSGDEHMALEKHLQECASCRCELDALRGDMALLSLAASGPRPPVRSRERLMKAISGEPRKSPTGKRSWWMLVPALALLALIVFAVVISRENSALRQQIASLQADS